MDQSAEVPSNPKVDVLVANITDLMNEVEEMLNDSSSQHAEDQVALLRTQYDTLQSNFAALCRSAGRTLTTGVREADRCIRGHPYRSVALALGAGVLIGALCTRNRA